MQSVQTALPYGCHFLDNTSNHIIGLRNMRGHGEMLAVRGESTAHQSMVLIQWSGPHASCKSCTLISRCSDASSQQPRGSIRARARPANPSLYQATARIYGADSLTGNEKRNTVPWGAFVAAER